MTWLKDDMEFPAYEGNWICSFFLPITQSENKK
jgi:hypothetical protein